MPPLTALKGPAEQQRNQSQLQFDGYHRTPSGIIQHIPIAPRAGPAGLEQYAPATLVRVPLRPLSLCALTAFLTAPLATGSAQ